MNLEFNKNSISLTFQVFCISFDGITKERKKKIKRSAHVIGG